MSPEDDPNWPICHAMIDPVGPCPDYMVNNWCIHLANRLKNREDAGDWTYGTRMCVPVLAVMDLFAEVAIDAEMVATGLARISLVKSLPFSQDEELIDLGLLTKNEGRFAVRNVIVDYLAGVSGEGNPQCPQSAHGFAEERRQVELRSRYTEESVKIANAFCIASKGMCYACYDKFWQGSVTVTNFGIDPDAVGNQGNSATKAALKNKLGATS